jgi:hypothetical protein
VSAQIEHTVVDFPRAEKAGENRLTRNASLLDLDAFLDQNLGRQGESPISGNQIHAGVLQKRCRGSFVGRFHETSENVPTSDYLSEKLLSERNGIVGGDEPGFALLPAQIFRVCYQKNQKNQGDSLHFYLQIIVVLSPR